MFVAAFSVPYRGTVPSAQRPVGSGFGAATTAAEVLEGIDLTGRLAVVTGGYSGIGLETTRALIGAGARVVVPARRPAAAAEALAGVEGVEIDELDLGDLDSVAAFADRFLASGRHIDLLVANAGIMACPETRVGPGWEAQFATNHLGHFALVNRLWPAIASVGARVVSVSSLGHRRSRMRWDDVQFERGYDKWAAYGQAKTANVLFAVHLDSLGEAAGVRAFSLHPGGIITPLQRHLGTEEMVAFGWIDENGNPIGSGFKSPEQGAATTVWAATSPQLAGIGGVYCEDCDVAEPTDDPNILRGVRSWAIDTDEAARLWALSSTLTGVDALASLNTRPWSRSAGVGCFARCVAMMTRRLKLCPGGRGETWQHEPTSAASQPDRVPSKSLPPLSSMDRMANGEHLGQCPTCGGHQWWDNRAHKAMGELNRVQPDYVCAICRHGRWIDGRQRSGLGGADRTSGTVGQSDSRGAGRRAGERRRPGRDLCSVEARRVTMPEWGDGRVTVLWPTLRRRRGQARAEHVPRHDQGRQAMPGWRCSGNPLLPATRTTTLTKLWSQRRGRRQPNLRPSG